MPQALVEYYLPKPPAGVRPEFMDAFESVIRHVVEFCETGREAFSKDPESSSRFIQLNVRACAGLFHKWNMEILYLLGFLPKLRFTELQKLLGGVSHKILSQKLAGLEDLGLLRRNVSGTRPVRVEYELTAAGKTMSQLTVPLVIMGSMRAGLQPPSHIRDINPKTVPSARPVRVGGSGRRPRRRASSPN